MCTFLCIENVYTFNLQENHLVYSLLKCLLTDNKLFSGLHFGIINTYIAYKTLIELLSPTSLNLIMKKQNFDLSLYYTQIQLTLIKKEVITKTDKLL